MKGLMGLVVVVLFLGLAGMGCQGGGEKPAGDKAAPKPPAAGMDLETCIKEFSRITNEGSGGMLPAEEVKNLAETACTKQCSISPEACQNVIDTVKRIPKPN